MASGLSGDRKEVKAQTEGQALNISEEESTGTSVL
jgi:hypothetical protein